MSRTLMGAMTLGLVAAGSLAAAPAHAASVSVTSPTCNQIKVTNSTSGTKIFAFDAGVTKTVGARQTITYTAAPAGSHVWRYGTSTSRLVPGASRVTAKPCRSTSAKRIVEGDQNKDGRADVLGILRNGNLMYYKATATGLAPGVKTGSGYGSYVWLRQVNNILGDGSGNYLLGVKSDGAVIIRQSTGSGHYGPEGRLGSLKGYSQFAVTTSDNPLSWGRHMLLAKQGSTLYGFNITPAGKLSSRIVITAGWGSMVKTMATRDSNGDNMGEILGINKSGVMYRYKVSDSATARTKLAGGTIVGRGWQTTALAVAPGSMNGDLLGDVVARRSNGELYRYTGNARGFAGTRIGTGWGVVRLIG